MSLLQIRASSKAAIDRRMEQATWRRRNLCVGDESDVLSLEERDILEIGRYVDALEASIKNVNKC